MHAHQRQRSHLGKIASGDSPPDALAFRPVHTKGVAQDPVPVVAERSAARDASPPAHAVLELDV